MEDKKDRTNNTIACAQERWMEVEKGIEDHAKLLAQLSQIAEKFQAVDSVFSDFKQAQLEIRSLDEQLSQYSENLRSIRSHVRQLRSMTLIAILLGLLSFAFSVVNLFQH